MIFNKQTETEITPRQARTPEETEYLEAIGTLFDQLHHHLLRWVSLFDQDGDLEKIPTQEAAILELFNAVRLLFDGHTRHSHGLRENLDAFGKLFGFAIQPHLPINAEDLAFLKTHSITLADDGRG